VAIGHSARAAWIGSHLAAAARIVDARKLRHVDAYVIADQLYPPATVPGVPRLRQALVDYNSNPRRCACFGRAASTSASRSERARQLYFTAPFITFDRRSRTDRGLDCRLIVNKKSRRRAHF